MIRNQILGALALVAGLVVSQKALSVIPGSETPAQFEERLAHLKRVCAGDLASYCGEVTPGEGRIAACLDSRLNQLSTSCRLAWADAKADISLQFDKGKAPFEKNCGDDVRKFCSAIPTGRGSIIDCLVRHEDELSASCRNLSAKITERLNAYLG